MKKRTISDVVRELKDTINVAEWLARRVPTRPGGKNTLVQCPFCHSSDFGNGRAQERYYKCYRVGCPTGNQPLDIISLASWMKYGREPEGEIFIEVVRELCAEYGILPPDTEKPQQMDPETRLRYLFRDAVWFWMQRLQDQDDEAERARNYLKQRGVTEEQIAEKQIGYAPRGKRLTSYLLKKGYTLEELEAASLTNSRGHDFFQGRVIIPVNLNGSEGTVYGRDIFDLGKEFRHLYLRGREPSGLYGLRKAKTVLLSEGIFDALAQERAYKEAGLPEIWGDVCSVATYGTQGFREEYIKDLLEAGVQRVIVAADADTPGLLAARKTATLLQKHFVVSITLFPEGHDPNSFYTERGAQAWREAIEASIPLVDLNVLLKLKEFDLSKRTERILAFQEIDKYLKQEGQTIRELTIGYLSEKLGVSPSSIRADLSPETPAGNTPRPAPKPVPQPVTRPAPAIGTERMKGLLIRRRRTRLF